MIVIDSSAIIAIFRQEDDAAHYAHSIATDDDPIMSAANVVEVSIVLRGLKKVAPDKAERWLDDFIEMAGIRIEPVTNPDRAGNEGTGSCSPLSPYAVRKRHRPCGVTELWRLLLIRAGKGNERSPALQGKRLSIDRYPYCLAAAGESSRNPLLQERD